MLKYMNSRIKTLQKNKSKAINLLHIAQNSPNNNKHNQILRLKTTINVIKLALRKEFNKSVADYWKGQLKQINYKDPIAFFPKINRLLRNKKLIAIEN